MTSEVKIETYFQTSITGLIIIETIYYRNNEILKSNILLNFRSCQY